MKNCLFVLIGLLCTNLGAQVKKEIFESFKLQERRNVSYYFPEDYSEEKKYPLILVLDAEYLFDQVVAISKFNSQFQGMPQTIIIGIDQLEDELRWEDCAFDEQTGLPTEKGKLFFEFLGMEIIPSIDTKYSTAPFKMVIGYDITANFMNYWLFKDHSLFKSYISISPLLAPEMESRIPERLATMDKHIFYNLITAGNRDKITNNILQLDRGLKSLGKENIHYSLDEYPDANELSVITYGLGKAWERTFQMFKPISPKEYKTEILVSNDPVINYLEDRYNMIEELFGFEKPMELNDIMAIYAASLKKEDFESLKPLSDICKKLFPDTMLGFYFEGEYFEQLGEPKKAFKAFEKAFQMEEIDFLTKDMALEKIDALKADFGY
ncbi:esterase [Flagellimonas sp. HMM57]|uniref:alpha/beta hydrolase n=1 Tax=unclassified Flagellimonas TaxID=2644544 RepID=UPI0013D38383|nr:MULTISPECIES: alpha/beta hydrolase-fold protein [unclassified Flagellimonas]UII74469.1 esterase [Flagellimonas sp. HMM57]